MFSPIPRHVQISCSILVAITCVLARPLSCGALVLSSATFDEGLQGPAPNVAGVDRLLPESIQLVRETVFGGKVFSTLTTTGGAFPTISLFLSAIGGPLTFGRGDIEYHFGVEGIGPGPFPLSVPVHVRASGSTSATTEGTSYVAFMTVNVQFSGAGVFAFDNAAACAPSSPCPGGTLPDFFLDEILMVELNRSVEVHLTAFGSLEAQRFPFTGSGEAQGIVDPLIEIDPNFPERERFRLAFSPGISAQPPSPPPPPGVPEPSTLLLLGSGLAACGFARWQAACLAGRRGGGRTP